MNSYIVSIRPKWVKKIVNREKTIEVRKSAPKEVPFKAYIYCSYGNDKENYMLGRRGKVIGEFVCDKVDEYKFHEGLTEFNSMGLPSRIYGSYLIFADDYKSMCLSYDEVKSYGKGETLYGWHISDLKIYDKPKELNEFNRPCPVENRDCEHCITYGKPYTWDFDEKKGEIFCTRRVTRPPQSYMRVEELGE